MAVRVTAGRISIVATLAVAMGAVVYVLPAYDPALPAATVCTVSTYTKSVTAEFVEPGQGAAVFSPGNAMPGSITVIPSESGFWCAETCSARKEFEPEYECTDAVCARGMTPCSSSIQYTYMDVMGNEVPQAIATAVSVFVEDTPLGDNYYDGACSAVVTYTVQTCSTTGTSSTSAGTPTSTASTASVASVASVASTASTTSTASTASSYVSTSTASSYASTSAASSYVSTSVTSTVSTSTASHSSALSTVSTVSSASTTSASASSSSTSSSYASSYSSVSSYYVVTYSAASVYSTTSASSAYSESSSSSSAGWCGDGILAPPDPGPDGVEGTDDDVVEEECDEGEANGVGSFLCSAECELARCGDGVEQAWKGEQCDDGAANADDPYAECRSDCTLPVCNDMLDNDGDGTSDAGDGGCHDPICSVADDTYRPGDMDESNPCQVNSYNLDGSATAFSPGEMKEVGETCTSTSQCVGNESGTVFCLSDTPGEDVTSGTCRDVAGGSLTAQVGAGAAGPFIFPNCRVGPGCGFFAGDEAACAAVGGLDGDTCANQLLRKNCLQASAQAQCFGGNLVPVPFGAEWRCTTPGQPDMCGPAGQWFCLCPGDPMPPLWVDQRHQCGTECGDGKTDAGEECDDGNKVDGDGCSATCKLPGNECANLPDACGNGAANQCQPNERCENTNAFPCAKCVPVVGGECKGNECDIAEASGAVPPGKECTLTGEFPCVDWVGPFACGNGEIDPPTEVDEGCIVTGTSGQFCVPENMVMDDFGRFHPSHQCYMGAHCKNTNGQCAWEMTDELEQCLRDNDAQNAGLPEGCRCDGGRLNADCPVDYVRNPCEELPGAEFQDGRWNFRSLTDAATANPLVAQANQQEGLCAVTHDARACCDQTGARVGWQSRTCPDGDWGPCNAGTVENCSIVPGTHCRPWVCPDGRTFPSCENGNPINYVQNPCNNLPPACERGGCFGELCVPVGTAPPSQCDIVPNVACYDAAECAWQGSGCGWTMTPTLEQCLADNADSDCATDEACLDSGACTAQGGSPGASCGADGGKVCCSGVITDGPVEQCDDGNQIDGDACGNDCEVNCRVNADCPGGAACVNGECVNQCVMPVVNNGNDAALDQAMHPADRGLWGQLMALSEAFNLLP